jgi:hypothetical protein
VFLLILILAFLTICFGPALLAYRLLRRKPLWLRISIGLSWPVILVVGGMLAFQIKFYVDLPVGRCKDESGFRRLLCGISETYEYYAYRHGISRTYEGVAKHFRSLPSDEEMIANFHEHRADFERLVQIYREDLSVPTLFIQLKPTPEVKAIMDRIHVGAVWGDGIIWLPPNPYSTEPSFLKRRRSLHLKLFSRETRQSRETREFSGVMLYYIHPTVMGFKYPLHKKYYYVPFAPRVKKGELLLPGGRGWACMAETLDSWPFDCRLSQCAYRQIEPHWLIGLCEGY